MVGIAAKPYEKSVVLNKLIAKVSYQQIINTDFASAIDVNVCQEMDSHSVFNRISWATRTCECTTPYSFRASCVRTYPNARENYIGSYDRKCDPRDETSVFCIPTENNDLVYTDCSCKRIPKKVGQKPPGKSNGVGCSGGLTLGQTHTMSVYSTIVFATGTTSRQVDGCYVQNSSTGTELAANYPCPLNNNGHVLEFEKGATYQACVEGDDDSPDTISFQWIVTSSIGHSKRDEFMQAVSYDKSVARERRNFKDVLLSRGGIRQAGQLLPRMADHARAKGPPAPPSLPSTPSRYQPGEDLNKLVESINRDFDLDIQIRGHYSPSKLDRDDLGNQVYEYIMFLFYQNKQALERAIKEFDSSAGQERSKESLNLFHKLMSDTVKACRPPSKTRTQDIRQPRSPTSSPHKAIRTPQQPTPLRFDRRSQRESRESYESYKTAPDPGSPTDEDTDNEMNPGLEARSPSPSPSFRPPHPSQASKPVSLHSARKRPLENSNHYGTSSKLTKTSRGKQAVNTSRNTEDSFKIPTVDMAPSRQPIPDPSSANPSFNNGIFWSQETANTAATSFTSFNGDTDAYRQPSSTVKAINGSSSTTLGSWDDESLIQAEKQFAMSTQNDRVCEQDIQTDLNRSFSQDSNGQSRSTFGSVDEEEFAKAAAKLEEKQNRSDPVACLEPSGVATNQQQHDSSTDKMPYDIRDIPKQSLFVEMLPVELEYIPYYVLFICLRIALEHSVPLRTIADVVDDSNIFTDPQTFWHSIDCYFKSLGRPTVKSRETNRLWQAVNREMDGFTFKGKLTFSSRRTGSIMCLRLLPIQEEKSCRLQRMFGSDRFLYLDLPEFNSSKIDGFTKDDIVKIRKKWQEWLLTEHSFLGRKWRVFHVDNIKRKHKSHQDDMLHDKKIVLSATEGTGIEQPYTVGEMLNKFLPMDLNKEQSFCKAFARIDLGLSRTIPTLCFDAEQIRRVRDSRSKGDQEDTRFNDTTLDWPPFPARTVMDDGCCVMSVGAAKKIWDLYTKATGVTDPLPSAFQGRIGGAKGIWVINAERFTKEPTHLEPWIMINDSQWKFEPPNDQSPYHRTFEVLNYSSTPSPSELHSLFIPILADRGVPKEAISDLMFDSLEKERMNLLNVLQDTTKVHEWVYRNGANTKLREETPGRAGQPASLEEKVLNLLESGFDPLKFPYLAQNLESFILSRQIFQEAKLRVLLPKSTFLYGVADPKGVLNPGEIQVLFSWPFLDETTNERYLELRDLNVLVARHPACRRSDIQKVRTVIHPELSHLVDVAVFSSKGSFPLAGKLQGGDYDGDIFWICWENTLVQPFFNAPAPVQPPEPSLYGIEKRTEKLKHIVDVKRPDKVDAFLKRAFEFRDHSSLLGQATILAESQAYSENCVHSGTLEKLYDVHDLLVDASKQGYILNQSKYNSSVKTLCENPKDPAYKRAAKDCKNARISIDTLKCREKKYGYKPDNILDYLYFDVVRAHNIETMKKVKEILENAIERDEVLIHPYQYLHDEGIAVVSKELSSLKEKIERVYGAWNEIWNNKKLVGEGRYALIEKCYQNYLAIQPDNPDDPNIRPWMAPYRRYGSCHWDTIKASALYNRYPWPEKLSFVFSLAGYTLSKLKAESFEGTRSVVLPIRANLKPRRIKTLSYSDELDDVDEDEYDFVTALEDQFPGFGDGY
ncbi:RNA dependent RNA polymerase-domain-containing protein [Bipolaris maydis]|nr:RNA dependent RNA polymerase-domain-containing protein [Bipolaris maydis]